MEIYTIILLYITIYDIQRHLQALHHEVLQLVRRAVPLLARHAFQQLRGLQEPAQELGIAPGARKKQRKSRENVGKPWEM